MKVRYASRRTACIATFANNPSRNCVKRPSKCACHHRRSSSQSERQSPTITSRTLQTVRLPWPARASVAHLKVKGTATVASFAASKSSSDPNHAQFQIAAIRRPDVRPQMNNGLKQRPARGGDARFAFRLCGGSGGRSFRSSYRGFSPANHPPPIAASGFSTVRLDDAASAMHMLGHEQKRKNQQNPDNLRLLRIRAWHRPCLRGSRSYLRHCSRR